MAKNIFICCIAIFGIYTSSCSQQNTLTQEELDKLTKSEIDLQLGNTAVKLLIYQNGADQGELYFNMHDDENTSVIASQKIIAKYGGTLATLSHSGERTISFEINGEQYAIDPNRIFTTIGIKNTLQKYGSYSKEAHAEVERFAQELIERLIQGKKFIIAMHNNKNSPTFSIKSYIPGGNYRDEAEDAFYNETMGTGEFFFTIERSHYEHFKDKKFSVVLQDNSKVTDDGSLSVYCAKQGISYINVEAQRGHLKEQVEMLEVLQELLPSFQK